VNFIFQSQNEGSQIVLFSITPLLCCKDFVPPKFEKLGSIKAKANGWYAYRPRRQQQPEGTVPAFVEDVNSINLRL
jgi:hypothetical protein